MAEANRDEASRCHRLSRKFFAENEYELAVKYAEKAVRLFSTSEHENWLASVCTFAATRPTKQRMPDKETDESTPLNGAQEKAEGHNFDKDNLENIKNYTKEQVEQVKIFLKINKEDYYQVLGVQRNSSESEIKKSYRKFHPDKNNAPGADEAFKIVSRAFSCLGDPQKRAAYDRYGGESSASSAHHAAHSSPFGEEINPEELFNMFFGNTGGFGTPGGIQFQFHTGSSPFGNIFMNNFTAAAAAAAANNGYRQRRRQQAEAPANLLALIIQFVPMIVLAIVLYFLNRVQSTSTSYSSSSPTWESLSRHYSPLKTPDYPVGPYYTPSFNVEYYISNQLAEYWRNDQDRKRGALFFEREYTAELQRRCKKEEAELRRKREQAARDNNMILLDELNGQKEESCDMLYSLGIQ